MEVILSEILTLSDGLNITLSFSTPLDLILHYRSIPRTIKPSVSRRPTLFKILRSSSKGAEYL
jgi:hypothetical protein